MGIYRLSNELKDLIFIESLQLHLEPSRLREVATVSRLFYDILRPYLWHKIIIKRTPNSPNDYPCAAVVAALSADKTREPVNIKVKELRIDDSLPNDYRCRRSSPGMAVTEPPPSMAISSDPDLPKLLGQLPNLTKLSIINLDWSNPQSPFIGPLRMCLQQPSLKSVNINSGKHAYPVDLIDDCHTVETLTLSGDVIEAPEDGAALLPKPRHLRLQGAEHFGIVWPRIDTTGVRTLIIPYQEGMESEIEDTFPFYGSKLRSLSITWLDGGPYSDVEEDEYRADFWPDFQSLSELRELNISYPAWHSDWAQRLADFLDLFDPKMAKLEYLNIYLLVEFADSLHYEDIEGLPEFDSRLAHFQLATLKKVVLALCPNDPDGTAARDYGEPEGEDESNDDGEGDDGDGDEGDDEDEDEAEAGEEELEEEVEEVEVDGARSAETPEESADTPKSLAALAASSLKRVRRAFPATRARAPDLLSVELSEVLVPWEALFDE